MASTGTEGSGDRAKGVSYTKRFVTAAASSPPAEQATPDEGQPSGISTRTIVLSAIMVVLALLLFIMSAGFGSSATTVSDADAQRIFTLREQIQTAQSQMTNLPHATDTQRGLDSALSAGHEVADLQNDYRALTPQVAQADGELDDDAALTTRRNLTPYFSPSVAQSDLDPWYLLASDQHVDDAVGIPMSFDSGFIWQVQVPSTVQTDSTIPVTWLAVQTEVAEGQTPVVLGWARADYDMTRKTFVNITTGTTTTGEALRQEVRSS